MQARVQPGFGAIENERILAADDLFTVARDKYPVSPGHTLVIVKRPVARFRDLTGEEKARLLHWLDWSIAHLQTTLQPPPDGFNIGTNDGPAAGQTIVQLHWHVISRYTGDVPDPRGGVRFVIPEKARYWQVHSGRNLEGK
jgi:diadenosine tetraphosphate (Ap4A) HIT family hydrolase